MSRALRRLGPAWVLLLGAWSGAGPALAGERPAYLAACAPLYRHVYGEAVDFAGIAADPARGGCRAALETTRPATLSAKERIAFWVNAYNLFTLLLVAEEPGRWSVRQDGRALFSDVSVMVDGVRHSLDDIERIELPRDRPDPRVGFLLSCATRGCAPLPERLVEPATLTALIDEGLRRFLSRPGIVEIDPTSRAITIGQLLQPDWHGQDLVRAGTTVEALLAEHLLGREDPGARRAGAALRKGAVRLGYRPYDWRLNRVRRAYALP